MCVRGREKLKYSSSSPKWMMLGGESWRSTSGRQPRFWVGREHREGNWTSEHLHWALSVLKFCGINGDPWTTRASQAFCIDFPVYLDKAVLCCYFILLCQMCYSERGKDFFFRIKIQKNMNWMSSTALIYKINSIIGFRMHVYRCSSILWCLSV